MLLFYVIVTTDTERKWTPLELYNIYKRNNPIETLWYMQKNHNQFLNRFFLQNNDRIEGLAVLLSMGALAHTVMKAIIRREVDKGFLQLPDDEGKKYDPKPTIERICRYFDRVGVSVAFKIVQNKLEIETCPCHFDEFVGGVLASLGDSWLVLSIAKTYERLFSLLVCNSK